MDLLKGSSIAGGVAFLIFAYLLFKNASGASTVANGFASAGTSVIKALQGNG